MDNVSSGLIYVVIAIVVGVFKFLKKSFIDPSKDSHSKPSKNLFEDTLSEINQEVNTKEKVDTIFGEQYTSNMFNEVYVKNEEHINKFETKVEDSKRNDEKYTPINKLELEEFDSDDEEEESSEFNLKRAVVYSEILNSKYC